MVSIGGKGVLAIWTRHLCVSDSSAYSHSVHAVYSPHTIQSVTESLIVRYVGLRSLYQQHGTHLLAEFFHGTSTFHKAGVELGLFLQSARHQQPISSSSSSSLTLSSPVVSNCYTSMCSRPYRSNPPILIF